RAPARAREPPRPKGTPRGRRARPGAPRQQEDSSKSPVCCRSDAPPGANDRTNATLRAPLPLQPEVDADEERPTDGTDGIRPLRRERLLVRDVGDAAVEPQLVADVVRTADVVDEDVAGERRRTEVLQRGLDLAAVLVSEDLLAHVLRLPRRRDRSPGDVDGELR